jgi:hypothetical protein
MPLCGWEKWRCPRGLVSWTLRSGRKVSGKENGPTPKRRAVRTQRQKSQNLVRTSVLHRATVEVILDEFEHSHKRFEVQFGVCDSYFRDVLDEGAHVLLLNGL